MAEASDTSSARTDQREKSPRRDLPTLIDSAQCQLEDAHHQLYAVRELARELRVSLGELDAEDQHPHASEMIDRCATISHLTKLAFERVLIAEDDLSEAGTLA